MDTTDNNKKHEKDQQQWKSLEALNGKNRKWSGSEQRETGSTYIQVSD